MRDAVKKISIRRRRALSIRTRVLTIALVPCIVFLLAGVAGAGYLIFDAVKTKNYYNVASETQRAALPLIVSLQEERRLSLRRLASYGTFQSELLNQRNRTDLLTEEVTANLAELGDIGPARVQRDVEEFTQLMRELPDLRSRVYGGTVSISETFAFYNGIIDQFIEGTTGLALFAPDAESSYLQLIVPPLLTAADLMQRADALAAANLVNGGATTSDFRPYQGLVSAYHLQLDATVQLADTTVRDQFAALVASAEWQRQAQVENVLVRGGTTLPISQDLWRGAARDVGNGLMGLLTTQSRHANAVALEKVNNTLTQAIIAFVVVLTLAGTAITVALRLSRKLIGRLIRLRRETLDLADNRLPELVERVRTGADVQVDDEIKLRGYGADEVGEVADAFNKAQLTAVAAAVQEAKTREGTNKVFLNIAHRSQVIVHRQLKVLDEAERKQEDPEQLEMLFQLDHLSTRARRNAENLIILGGGQPGRRWRNPVSLTELVRGASAETENFARVKVAKLPTLAVNGQAVGDLVHLLAELIDNATSFSPPESRVEVRANVVGRGVVLEIEDQGVGIEADRVEQLNDMLRNPPDFGIMALSTEPRLGLFVVARLAARHGISVTLRESAYGGTRAIVLVRSELLGEVPVIPDRSTDTSGSIEPVTSAAAAESPAPPEPARNGHVLNSTPVPGLPLLSSLPPIPIVIPQPGEDLFRPQRPVEESADEPTNGHQNGSTNGHGAHRADEDHAVPNHDQPTEIHKAIDPATLRPPQIQSNGSIAPGRPPLPQRRRQQNLAPQLRDETPTAWPQAEPTREDTPEQARSRLGAFQRGTRMAREEPTDDSDNEF
jgi:signal transduction histidine kinase